MMFNRIGDYGALVKPQIKRLAQNLNISMFDKKGVICYNVPRNLKYVVIVGWVRCVGGLNPQSQ